MGAKGSAGTRARKIVGRTAVPDVRVRLGPPVTPPPHDTREPDESPMTSPAAVEARMMSATGAWSCQNQDAQKQHGVTFQAACVTVGARL